MLYVITTCLNLELEYNEPTEFLGLYHNNNMELLIGILIVAMIACILLITVSIKKSNKTNTENTELKEKQKALVSQIESLQTLYGQAVEKVVPFMSDLQEYFPDIKYLGEPIDYIAFSRTRDMITFIEVKSGKARLTKKQERIKKLVENGNVEFKEIRIEREAN